MIMQAAFGQEELLTDILKEHQNNHLTLLEPADE